MDLMDSEGSNSRQFDDDSDSMTQYIQYQLQQELFQQQPEPAGEGKRKLGDTSIEESSLPVAEGLTNGDEGPSPNKKILLEQAAAPEVPLNRQILPELDKFWKAVEADPNDFTAWTQLLQYVDGENEVLAAREAYDKFLGKYPYCYGYWKKYADFEKKKGSPEFCEQVFRRGLKAISLSVDLWIHYLNYVKSSNEGNPEIIRVQFEEAITACGIEFRSDKLWEHYIQWEKENEKFDNVLRIYDRVLATPTQNYQIHFQNIKELVSQHKPSEIISFEELQQLQKLASADSSGPLDEEAEMSKIRELIIEKRSEIYKKNELEITARWSYEEAIKRPYFHVKPLEKGQLKMWKEYLDFEIGKGDKKRIIILFERCLIACALYEEYWIKYARYLLNENDKEGGSLTSQVEDVFRRACTIHHPNKPWVNFYWAAFQESKGNFDAAVSILEKLEGETKDTLLICYRRINLERRRGNIAGCVQLFQHYIGTLKDKNKANCAHISIKFAQFVYKIMGDYEGAKKILQDSIDLDETTRARVIMSLVNMGMEKTPVDSELVLSTFNAALSGEMAEEQKVTFAHRKIEFLEDYGTSVEQVNKAQDELQRLAKIMREKKSSAPAPATAATTNTEGGEEGKVKNGEDGVKTETATTNGTSAAAYDQYAYSQQYNQYGNYANWNYSQSSGYGYNQEGWNAYQGYYGATNSTTGA